MALEDHTAKLEAVQYGTEKAWDNWLNDADNATLILDVVTDAVRGWLVTHTEAILDRIEKAVKEARP